MGQDTLRAGATRRLVLPRLDIAPGPAMPRIMAVDSFKNYIIFEAPPTGQSKNYAIEKGGYIPRLKCPKNGLRNC